MCIYVLIDPQCRHFKNTWFLKAERYRYVKHDVNILCSYAVEIRSSHYKMGGTCRRDGKYPYLIHECQPKGRRDVWCPGIRWKDQFYFFVRFKVKQTFIPLIIIF
jgi:hypothetical protein